VRLRLRELVATSLGQSLGAVLESMTDGFAAADASGAITAVNDAFCELLGYRRDEIIGAVPPYPFWAPEATRELEDALVEVLSGASTHVRLRYRHRDGHRLTLAASVSPLVGPDGAPAGAVGLFRDDTAQEAVERRLRASADELRGLVDHLPGAAVLRLPDGSLRLNARARELIGWPERELATVEDWFRLLYAGRAEDVQARYERARAEGFPSSVIGRLATPTGTRVMEFFAYRAPDHSEVWLATDVTERLEAQEERDRQAARLAAVMEALPDLVIRLRRDGRMMAAHGAPELLAVNDPSADVNIREVLPPEVAQMSLAAIAAALDTGEIQQIQYPLEVGAGRRWFTTRIAPMAGDEVVCVVRDDTERLHAERDRDRVFRITAAPMAVWDLSGRALEINPAMERLLGWSVQELDAMGVDGWVHPEDLPAVNDAISRLARGLASQNLPQRLRRKGGGWVWTEVTASPDRVSVHDITDRRRTELEQQSLARVAEMVAQDVEPDVLFGVVAEEVGRLFESDGAGVARFDGDVMRIAARWGDDPGLTAEAAGESPLEGDRASAEVARTGRPARYDRWLPDQSGRVQRSSVAAPVRVAGRLWGAVGAVNTTRGRFEDGAEDHLARFGELLALAISNAQMRARLIAEATTDPLTGLANHRSFKERLAEEMARAQRHRRPLALAVIDLDHFKRVNDRFGHQVGDAVLVEAARRLRERCRATDLIARVGGEEFAWLMPETDGLDAWQAAERAREALAGTLFATAGRVTASIGVCDLTHAGTADDLYRFADGALYWAKHHGRDVAFMYSPDVVEVLSDAEQAERLLRHQAMQSIRVLARAVDAKDTSTREHSERVADTAVAIGARPCCARRAWCTTSARSPSRIRSCPSRAGSPPRSTRPSRPTPRPGRRSSRTS